MIKYLFAKTKRLINFQICKRFLYEKSLKKHKIHLTKSFLQEFSGKKILMMDASPLVNNMFQQRPHHFVNFWHKYFDVVIYKSFRVIEPTLLKDNIYEVPDLPIWKGKNIQIYYYLSSVACPPYRKFKKLKKCNYKIIYDYYDEINEQIAKTNNAIKVHKNLDKLKPNLVIATSDKLYNDVADKGLPNLILVKNGVTVEDFDKKVLYAEDDIKQVVENKNPIIGYYGYLAEWIDLDLIEKCLIAYPNYNFVFIGKIMKDISLDKLSKHNNFYYLGHKNYKDLYKYSSFFNCALIPFKHGKIAKATSPNKLFEYMAVGAPVVCTRDLIECRGYDGVLMSKDDEEFIQNISQAIQLSKDDTMKNKLKKYAKENTWEEKANIILNNIKEL